MLCVLTAVWASELPNASIRDDDDNNTVHNAVGSDRVQRYRKSCLPRALEQEPTNVALGKKVLYSVKPGKWKDNDEKSILTDGIKCAEGTGEYHNMIGYHGGASYITLEIIGINMCIDLEKVEVLKETSINLNGHVRFRKPREVTCVVSLDGTNFYTVATKQRLLSYGKATKPFAETYCSGGEGDSDNPLLASEDAVKVFKPAGWQTLTFDLSGIKARYVGLHIKGAGIIFNASEWEIHNDFARNIDESLNHDLYSPERRAFFRIGHGLAPADDVYFGPRDDIAEDTLYISDNITTPNFCYMVDRRLNGKKNPDAKDKAPLEFVINLPGSVELIETELLRAHNVKLVKDDNTNRNVYSFVIDKTKNKSRWTKIHSFTYIGPFYFLAKQKIDGDEFVEFYCRTKYATYTARKLPIKTITIPKVEKPLPFPVALTWMIDGQSADWPEFVESYAHLGFNHFPVFPLAMSYGGQSGSDPVIPERTKTLIAEARKHDMKLILVDSPLHPMEGGRKVIGCQGADRHSRLCPSYRGEYYTNEIKRIGRISKVVKPNIFMADIEVFADGTKIRDSCTRCLAGQERTALSGKEYFANCGTEIMADIAQVVRVDNTNVTIGLYACAGGIHHGVFDFKKLYPRYIQLAQASLYEAGHMDVYHRVLAAMYLNTGKKKWVGWPWLTAGTYGEIPSHKLEIMLYECVLNGSSVGFYSFKEFDTALDYFYLAKALSTLSHYHDLLKTGNPSLYHGNNNPKLFYSCFKNKEEALLHIGNYTSCRVENVILNLPIEGEVVVTDVKTGKPLTVLPAESGSGRVTVAIAPQQSALLHVSGLRK